MKKIISAIIFTMSLLILTGCSDKITKGEIYQKEFEPAHSETMVIPITHVSTNGKTTFTTTTMTPIVRHYSDSYKIFIRAWNSENNDWDTAIYYTNKEIYDSANIGEYFEYVSNRDKDEQMYYDEKQ